MATNNAVKIEKLNNRADKVEKPEDAADIIREYEEILRAKKRASSWLRFTKEKFLNALRKRKSFKKWSTIIFKINIFKLIEKYPKLMRSSVTLIFLKNYLKDIKKFCEDNLSDFK